MYSNFSANIAPRLGITYDLCGNGRTAVKAMLTFLQSVPDPSSRNRPTRMLITQQVPWTDPNGNLRVDQRAEPVDVHPGFAAGSSTDRSGRQPAIR